MTGSTSICVLSMELKSLDIVAYHKDWRQLETARLAPCKMSKNAYQSWHNLFVAWEQRAKLHAKGLTFWDTLLSPSDSPYLPLFISIFLPFSLTHVVSLSLSLCLSLSQTHTAPPTIMSKPLAAPPSPVCQVTANTSHTHTHRRKRPTHNLYKEAIHSTRTLICAYTHHEHHSHTQYYHLYRPMSVP